MEEKPSTESQILMEVTKAENLPKVSGLKQLDKGKLKSVEAQGVISKPALDGKSQMSSEL